MLRTSEREKRVILLENIPCGNATRDVQFRAKGGQSEPALCYLYFRGLNHKGYLFEQECAHTLGGIDNKVATRCHIAYCAT